MEDNFLYTFPSELSSRHRPAFSHGKGQSWMEIPTLGFSWWGPNFSLFDASNFIHVEVDEPPNADTAELTAQPPVGKSLKSFSSKINPSSCAPNQAFVNSRQSCFQYSSAQGCIQSRDRLSNLDGGCKADAYGISAFCVSSVTRGPRGSQRNRTQ